MSDTEIDQKPCDAGYEQCVEYRTRIGDLFAQVTAFTAREAALREALEKTWELVKESAFATDDESFLRQIKTSGAPTQERDYEVAQIVIAALKSPAA